MVAQHVQSPLTFSYSAYHEVCVIKNLLHAAVILCAAGMADAAEIVPPTDHRIHYTGRWDFSDPSAPWCAWQGSSLKTSFHGTAIRGDFDGGRRGEFIRLRFLKLRI